MYREPKAPGKNGRHLRVLPRSGPRPTPSRVMRQAWAAAVRRMALRRAA
jgi:hypothetical protein